MPLHIDEAWEYYVPDSEIDEALNESSWVEPTERLEGSSEENTTLRYRFCKTPTEGWRSGRKNVLTSLESQNILREMWAAGHSVKAIASVLDVLPKTVSIWKRRLGLAPRPQGNHSRRRATA